MATVKCFYCGKPFDREKEPYVKPRSNRYGHAACAANTNLEVFYPIKCCYCGKEINGNYKALGKGQTAHLECWNNNLSDKDKLEEYIKKLFNETYINPRIQKQIEDYTNNKGYTYSGILKSLIYFYEVKGNSIEKANGGIGIVPFVYADSKKYYYQLWQIQEINKEKNIKTYSTIPREITIINPERKSKKKNLFSFLDNE